MENPTQPNLVSEESTATPLESPAQPPSTPQKKWWMLGGIALLLVVGGLSYYLGTQTPQSSDSLSQLSSSATPDPITQDTSIERIQSELGFSLVPPAGWTLTPIPSASLNWTINEVEMKMVDRAGDLVPVPATERDPQKFGKISISFTGENTKTVEQIAKDWRTGETDKISVGNHPAVQVISKNSDEGSGLVKGGYTISVFVKNLEGKTILFQLETANVDAYQPAFNQMLGSVKFECPSGSCADPQQAADTWQRHRYLSNGQLVWDISQPPQTKANEAGLHEGYLGLETVDEYKHEFFAEFSYPFILENEYASAKNLTDIMQAYVKTNLEPKDFTIKSITDFKHSQNVSIKIVKAVEELPGGGAPRTMPYAFVFIDKHTDQAGNPKPYSFISIKLLSGSEQDISDLNTFTEKLVKGVRF
jgi:hypothetical protein